MSRSDGKGWGVSIGEESQPQQKKKTSWANRTEQDVTTKTILPGHELRKES